MKQTAEERYVVCQRRDYDYLTQIKVGLSWHIFELMRSRWEFVDRFLDNRTMDFLLDQLVLL